MPSVMVIQWLFDALKQPVEKHSHLLIPHYADMAWDELVQLADRYGLSPLLYHQLHGDIGLWSAIPVNIQEHLEQRYLASAQRNLQIYYQFLKLIKALKQYETPVILLKGIYLAHAVYGDRALRPMVDVDILVNWQDLATVENTLHTLGFRLSEWRNREWCLRNHYHLAFVHPELDFTVEVHWHIQRPEAPYVVEIDELWGHAQPVTIAGVRLLALSNEHLVLHQCLHIAKHAFRIGPRPVYDLVATLLRYQSQIDWYQVQFLAERWRLSKTVFLALYFAHEFFDGVPELVMKRFTPGEMEPVILDTARQQILAFGSTSKRLSTEFLQLWEEDQEQRKVAHLFRRVFLPRDLMAGIYQLPPSSWRLYLYYPVRLFDLLTRYPLVVRNLIHRDDVTLNWAQQTTKVDALQEWLAT